MEARISTLPRWRESDDGRGFHEDEEIKRWLLTKVVKKEASTTLEDIIIRACMTSSQCVCRTTSDH
jgi:hypothetical protein